MVCDFCHENDAVIFIEQVSGGKKRKISVCKSCAEERGLSGDPRSIEKGLANIVKEILSQEQKQKQMDEKACPVCGLSLGKIMRNSMIGCPECYSVFKNEILSLMEKNNIKGTYTGSMPHRLKGFKSTLTDRILYQNKLNEALAREDYEKAAVYRDYLKALEKGPVEADPDEDSQKSFGENADEK